MIYLARVGEIFKKKEKESNLTFETFRTQTRPSTFGETR